MRVSATILVVVAAASLTLSPVFAGSANKPSSKPPKPTNVVKPTTVGKPVGGPKPTTGVKLSKPPSSGKPVKSTAVRTTGKPTKSTAVKPAATAKSTKPAAGRTTAVASGTTTPLNPIAQKIASKPNLSSKLTRMLPVDPLTGKTMTLDKASLGFKNQGQFIAALHVSQNLGIPFTELKSRMVTVKPGAPGELPIATQTGSLGQAIQASKASVDAPTEVILAEAQAAADVQTTSTKVSTTSPQAKAKKKATAGAQ